MEMQPEIIDGGAAPQAQQATSSFEKATGTTLPWQYKLDEYVAYMRENHPTVSAAIDDAMSKGGQLLGGLEDKARGAWHGFREDHPNVARNIDTAVDGAESLAKSAAGHALDFSMTYVDRYRENLRKQYGDPDGEKSIGDYLKEDGIGGFLMKAFSADAEAIYEGARDIKHGVEERGGLSGIVDRIGARFRPQDAQAPEQPGEAPAPEIVPDEHPQGPMEDLGTPVELGWTDRSGDAARFESIEGQDAGDGEALTFD